MIVDSTCATPAIHSQPLVLSADLVMHSATKYLGGHSDVIAGALVTAVDDDNWAAIAALRRDEGACLGPFEAYLLLRGMRTLFARVGRSSATAAELAARLAELPGVTVRYPRPAHSHPQHAIAARQMQRGFGGMLSIEVGGGAARALAFVRKLAVWVPATSLGGVESLLEHRARDRRGPDSPTPPDLLRLSVGLEDVDDLFADLAAAVDVVKLRLATCPCCAKPDVDAEPLTAALAAAGIDAAMLAWDDPAVDWSEPVPTLLRSTWNYIRRARRVPRVDRSRRGGRRRCGTRRGSCAAT